MNYENISTLLKAIASPIRLEILNLLSCGELCACDLLAHFHITQPTLSHHMKALSANNLIHNRKEGNRHYYRLNTAAYQELLAQLNLIGTSQASCACHTLNKGDC